MRIVVLLDPMLKCRVIKAFIHLIAQRMAIVLHITLDVSRLERKRIAQATMVLLRTVQITGLLITFLLLLLVLIAVAGM